MRVVKDTWFVPSAENRAVNVGFGVVTEYLRGLTVEVEALAQRTK